MSKKFEWYTNGVDTIKVKPCQDIPEGYYKGRTFNYVAWNKGLTKETDERVKNGAKKTSESLKGKEPWNKGLTKNDNISLQVVSKKVSEYRKGKEPWNKGIPMSDESKEKLSKSHMGLPSWAKGLTKETDERIRRISEKQKGRKCYVVDWVSAKKKEYETKKKNGTLSNYESSAEKKFKKYFINMFGEENVKQQYFTDKYPYKCDFYIVSLDLYVEIHHAPWHNTHAYNKYSIDDNIELERLKNKHSKWYDYEIYTWTDLDVRKLETAKKNNLNFIAIYKNTITEVFRDDTIKNSVNFWKLL